MEIKKAILDVLDDLPSAERRLADVVLSHMDQLAIYSANELAEKASVSAATAVRFFRRLGFSGFSEFRMQARHQMNEAAPIRRLSSIAQEPSAGDMTAFINNDVQNIDETFKAITQSHLDRFTAVVPEARRVWVVGFRNGQMLASYMHSLLQQLRSDVLLLVGTVVHLAEQLSDIDSGDLVIVMDFRRRSVLLQTLVEHVRSENAQMVFLTDLLEPPLVKAKDISFVVKTRGEYLFDSHASTLSLINFLVSRVAMNAEASVSRKLQKIEVIHRGFRDLRSE
ncbi:MurR/RpiR family transcriptional regulator [Parapusillimonas sp. SGNA-6]|nr:MurR/RpiR family transcriptional regulator [Parapusillimonas sp. SGNA-6]